LRGGPNLNHAGRPEVRPGELLTARPDEFDGFTGGPREACGLDGGFAGVLAAVAAAHVGLDDVDLIGGEMKCLGELVANPEWSLCPCPDGEAGTVPFRDGGARLKRGVRNVLDSVLLVDMDRRGSQRLLYGTGGRLRTVAGIGAVFEDLE